MGVRLPGQGHANLAQGRPVRAAGQVQVSGGRIIEIDNASGHYLPIGPFAAQAALDAFRGVGLLAPDGAYIEKCWNPATRLWEPVHGDG